MESETLDQDPVMTGEITETGTVQLSDEALARLEAFAKERAGGGADDAPDTTEDQDVGLRDGEGGATDGTTGERNDALGDERSSQSDNQETTVASPGEGTGADTSAESGDETDWRTPVIERKAARYGLTGEQLATISSRDEFDRWTDWIDTQWEAAVQESPDEQAVDEGDAETEGDDEAAFQLPEHIDVEALEKADYDDDVIAMARTLNGTRDAVEKLAAENKAMRERLDQTHGTVSQFTAQQERQQEQQLEQQFTAACTELNPKWSDADRSEITMALGAAAQTLGSMNKPFDMKEATLMAARMLGKDMAAPSGKETSNPGTGQAEKVKRQSANRRPSPSVNRQAAGQPERPENLDERREWAMGQVLRDVRERQVRDGEV